MITKHKLESSEKKELIGNILSFDFGEKRIGVAVGNNLTKSSHPLETINTALNSERYKIIEQLIQLWSPIHIVIGLPLNDDGSISKMSLLAKKFATKLKNKFNLSFSLVDERFTSTEAESILKITQKNFKKRKLVVDQVAAQIILDSYFERGCHEPT
jgi:putative Holliday junction resolvase